MFCKKCGKELDDNAATCPNCGTATHGYYTGDPFGRDVNDDPFERDSATDYDERFGAGKSFWTPNRYNEQPVGNGTDGNGVAPADAPNMAWGVFGFLLPVVGLILWFVWHRRYPLRARSCLRGTLAGIALYVVFLILYLSILYLAGAASFASVAMRIFTAAL